MTARVLATNAAWSTAAHLFERGSVVAASMILSNFLEPEDFAVYSYFYLTISMLSAYAALGMGVTASRFFAESRHLPEDAWPPLGTLWCLSLLAGVALALTIVALPSELVSADLVLPNWVLALGVLALTANVVPNGGILGLERYQAATKTAFVAASFLLLGILAAAATHSLVAALLIFVVSSLIRAVCNTIVIAKTVRLSRLINQVHFGRKELIKVGAFAGPMLLVSLLSAGGPWLVGRIILEGPFGSTGFAIYAIGIQWLSLTLFIPGMVSRVLLPRFVANRLGEHATTNYGTRILLLRGTSLTLLAACVFAGVGYIASPLLVQLYGSDLALNPSLLSAFIIAALPAAVANTIGNAIVVNDGQRAWLAITMIWFIALVLGALLFTSIGPLGGAYAYGVASLILSGLAIIVVRQYGLK